MGGKIWRNRNKRRRSKHSRAKGVASKEAQQQSRDRDDTQIVVYDPDFARRQKLLYFRTCVVCRKGNYFLKSCSRCQLACCCNDDCLRKHCRGDDQRLMCVRNVTFSKARGRIPSALKDLIFQLGYSEISPHLYSIPRFEVHQLMGGPRSIVLLQVITAEIVNNFLQVLVQDVNGFCATLNLHPPPEALVFLDFVWCEEVKKSIPPNTFILLWNCCWNNHADVESAAVDIRDLNLIIRLECTEEIMKTITQKDYDAMIRSLQTSVT